MTPALIDTVRSVETPEGVVLKLRVAGLPARALAWLVDMLVRTAGYMAMATALSYLGDMGTGLMLIGLFLIEWFYPVFFEVWGGGATPGKRVLGLVVAHDDGSPVGLSASVLRNLLRAGDFLPVGFVFGVLSMLVSADNKRLGDYAAGTVVLHRSMPSPLKGLAPGPATPPALPLSPIEQQAILEFAARSGSWSAERRQELAGVLQPLTGARGEEAVNKLSAIARWVQGAP